MNPNDLLDMKLSEVSDLLLQRLCEGEPAGCRLLGVDEDGCRHELVLCMRRVE